ncbi:hypothetical protein Dsin_014707 [Dipteronia sinensis]|uniref:Exocyst complex subunit Exo70 C-terminal domain-containing protein n=1 Tax=Dipteronia sinensis TaxID=43782 RepID=A0AAE0ANN8_9ROSI|nr:hypothetical protein Dsin_014707 [Dipteronia sinensis]
MFDLAAAVVVWFLNFSEAVVMTKRSAEKLFKFLDMYETLRDLIPHINDSYSSEFKLHLIEEVSMGEDPDPRGRCEHFLRAGKLDQERWR